MARVRAALPSWAGWVVHQLPKGAPSIPGITHLNVNYSNVQQAEVRCPEEGCVWVALARVTCPSPSWEAGSIDPKPHRDTEKHLVGVGMDAGQTNNGSLLQARTVIPASWWRTLPFCSLAAFLRPIKHKKGQA